MNKTLILTITTLAAGGVLLAGAILLGDSLHMPFAAAAAFVAAWALLALGTWALLRQRQGVQAAVHGTRIDSERMWTEAMKQLDIEPRRDDERSNRWLFEYQGGNFYVDVDLTSAFSEVYYPFVEEVDLADIDEVSLVRRAINEANMACCPTLVYSVDEDEQKMYVHIVQSVFLLPQIPSIGAYLQSRLTAFFQLQRRFSSIEDRMRQEA